MWKNTLGWLAKGSDSNFNYYSTSTLAGVPWDRWINACMHTDTQKHGWKEGWRPGIWDTIPEFATVTDLWYLTSSAIASLPSNSISTRSSALTLTAFNNVNSASNVKHWTSLSSILLFFVSNFSLRQIMHLPRKLTSRWTSWHWQSWRRSLRQGKAQWLILVIITPSHSFRCSRTKSAPRSRMNRDLIPRFHLF